MNEVCELSQFCHLRGQKGSHVILYKLNIFLEFPSVLSFTSRRIQNDQKRIHSKVIALLIFISLEKCIKDVEQKACFLGTGSVYEILGPKYAENVFGGKSYAKRMRAHNLTWQAFCRLLLPQINTYMYLAAYGAAIRSGTCGSVDQASVLRPKWRRFDSRTGHK